MRQYRQHKKLPPAPSPNGGYRLFLSSFLKKITASLSSLKFTLSPLKSIVSLFGIGYLPLCPGTWGSLATLCVGFLLFPLLPMIFFIISIIVVFFIGTVTTALLIHTQKATKMDPSYIVIDEAVGQMISLLPVLTNIYYWPIAFIFFRLFDIKKPFLVSWPELNLHGTPISSSLSIMLDDVLAGIYAAGATYIIVLLINFYNLF